MSWFCKKLLLHSWVYDKTMPNLSDNRICQKCGERQVHYLGWDLDEWGVPASAKKCLVNDDYYHETERWD